MRTCPPLLLALVTVLLLAVPGRTQQVHDEDKEYFQRLALVCAQGGHDPEFRLAQSGMPPRKFTALFIAIAKKNMKRAKLLAPRPEHLDVQDKVSGATPMTWAAQAGNADMVAWLLDRGAGLAVPDGQQHTPLTTAVRFGQRETVRLLLGQGADPNGSTPLGQRPLHQACAKTGGLTMARLLVDAGANPHLPDNGGWTPLAMAAKWGHLSLVDYLLQLGVHPDGAPGSRFTPLHWAAAEDHLDVAARLLAAGAMPNSASPQGHTPLTWAKTNAMRDLLSQAVAAAENKPTLP